MFNSCLSYIRTLPGPEEAETGFVPPPLGRHLLRAPWAHVHVNPPASQNETRFRMWLPSWVRQHYTSHLNVYMYTPVSCLGRIRAGWFWKVEVLSKWEIWVEVFNLVFMEKKGKYIFKCRFRKNLIFSLRCNLFSFEQRAKPMHAAAVEGAQNQLIQKKKAKKPVLRSWYDGRILKHISVSITPSD